MNLSEIGRRASVARRIENALFSPMRLFMAVTGHKPDQTMTPVQPSEFAERARAQAYLLQMARDQEAHYVIRSAEDYLRELDDQIAGRPSRMTGAGRS